MYSLNIDKNSNRVLSACKMFNGAELADGIQVNELPEEGKVNIYDYLYVNGAFVYTPVTTTSAIATQFISSSESAIDTSLESRVATLESKIDKLAELVEKLTTSK